MWQQRCLSGIAERCAATSASGQFVAHAVL